MSTLFNRVYHARGVENRLTKIKHPWINDQVERMNGTIKEATVKCYYHPSHEELNKHLHAFLRVYNLNSRLKTLKGKSLYDFIKALWTSDPERFIANLIHFNVGLNNSGQVRMKCFWHIAWQYRAIVFIPETYFLSNAENRNTM